MAALQRPSVKVVAEALNIFTEVQKKTFETQTIAQMVSEISLKRHELINSCLKPIFVFNK